MRRTPWGRLAAVAAIALLVIGTFAWIATQSSSADTATAGLIGKPAPAASLQLVSSQGKLASLAQYKGKKIVLFFYEGATCGSCQQQLTVIQGLVAGRQDVVAVAASVDPASTSMNLATQLKLSYPILADTQHQLGTAFDDFHVEVAGMDMGNVDNHAVYVIDAHGVVRWVKQAADTMWIPASDITAALNQA